MNPFKFYAMVVLDLGIQKHLTYGVPDSLLPLVKPGVKVEIPVRGRSQTGYVESLSEKSSFLKVQPILKVLSDGEIITPDLRELSDWMKKYYGASPSAILKTLLPSSVRKETKPKQQFYVMRGKSRDELRQACISLRQIYPAQADVLDIMLLVNKGILLSELLEKTKGSRSPIASLVKKGYLTMDLLRIDRSPLENADYLKSKSKPLNDYQQIAFNKIIESLKKNVYETHLLYGVTGSGKTEVYLQAIEFALSQNKGTIMLVPEIALTAQTIERFRSRFEGKIAILHHRLSNGERFDEWHRAKRGEAKIVIGARSAIFTPVLNLGLIIVDEEHENSYKQNEESPCYHARDVAVMRGKISQSTVILGSATPALESFYNAKIGKYTLSTLSKRADNATIPKVTIVDMRHECDKAKGFTLFSDALLSGIKKRFECGEQTLLFLNRRGYHSAVMCQGCQSAIKCQHCDVTLTFHKSDNQLTCHLCGYILSPPPKECPNCHHSILKFKGVGTEQVERTLHALLPEIRTLRIDADTTRHKGSHEMLFRKFRRGKADVLIGTQMVTKGLHFPQVTLVGVLNSDATLHIPDFRSSETAYQLITQVSGRAGRSLLSGEVIIQTSMPDNLTIQFASMQEYESFYDEEIKIRKEFNYPPFTRLAKVKFVGSDPMNTECYANQVREILLKLLGNLFEIHPLLPGGHAKVKDFFHFQFLAKGQQHYAFNRALKEALLIHPRPAGIRLLVDIDPTSTFF